MVFGRFSGFVGFGGFGWSMVFRVGISQDFCWVWFRSNFLFRVDLRVWLVLRWVLISVWAVFRFGVFDIWVCVLVLIGYLWWFGFRVSRVRVWLTGCFSVGWLGILLCVGVGGFWWWYFRGLFWLELALILVDLLFWFKLCLFDCGIWKFGVYVLFCDCVTWVAFGAWCLCWYTVILLWVDYTGVFPGDFGFWIWGLFFDFCLFKLGLLCLLFFGFCCVCALLFWLVCCLVLLWLYFRIGCFGFVCGSCFWLDCIALVCLSVLLFVLGDWFGLFDLMLSF